MTFIWPYFFLIIEVLLIALIFEREDLTNNSLSNPQISISMIKFFNDILG